MTTVIAVKRDGKVAVGGDGQITLGSSKVKAKAKKVRRIYDGKVVVGFAGSVVDSIALLDRLEEKLRKFGGNLLRSCVELSKDWRTDRYLRRLEAFLIATDGESMFLLSGSGDLIEPDEPVLAIGSGGDYARACALALLKHTKLSAREIVLESLKVASKICIYTNDNFTVEEI